MPYGEKLEDWCLFLTYLDNGQIPFINDQIIDLSKGRNIQVHFDKLVLFERGNRHYFFGCIVARGVTNNNMAFLAQDIELGLWPYDLQIKMVRYRKGAKVWNEFVQRENVY